MQAIVCVIAVNSKTHAFTAVITYVLCYLFLRVCTCIYRRSHTNGRPRQQHRNPPCCISWILVSSIAVRLRWTKTPPGSIYPHYRSGHSRPKSRVVLWRWRPQSPICNEGFLRFKWLRTKKDNDRDLLSYSKQSSTWDHRLSEKS